jgi:[acyl-carrier-protein] S-malonyltransferase
MDKIVFLFPGVGSQYVGMGKTFYENFKVFRETFAEAGDITGRDFPGMCFSGDKTGELSRVDNAQLAILTMSTALFKVYMQEIGLKPHYCMGHSLGEYTALCCSGIISFPHALKLVRQRGTIIKEVSSSLDGTMMWVINLEQEIVEQVCRDVFTPGKEVYISAYDSPTQTSISGRSEAVLSAAKKMEQAGAIVYPLKMSGPFHSPLMAEAAEQMESVLRQYQFAEPLYPVIANCSARPYENKSSVVRNLSRQLVSPIRWRESITYVLQQGAAIALEMGPKDVLKFLMKKNTAAIQPFAEDNKEDWQSLKKRFLVAEEEYPQVIGRCLGAAVSTRNRDIDNKNYEEEVSKPYNRIAHLYEKLIETEESASAEQVAEALHMLRSVLNAKKVPQQEQEKKLNKILKGRLLCPPRPSEI